MNELDFCEHKKFTISFTNLNEIKRSLQTISNILKMLNGICKKRWTTWLMKIIKISENGLTII